jgi:hypothetical protein
VNRAAWNLRLDAYKRIPRKNLPPFFEPTGPEALPGTYKVRVSYKDQQAEGTLKVLPDPRLSSLTREAQEANLHALERAGRLQEAVAEAVARIQRTRTDLDAALAKFKAREDADKKDGSETKEKGPSAELSKSARELRRKLDELERRLWVPEGSKGLLPRVGLESQIDEVARSIGSSWDAPNPAQLANLDRAETQTREVLADINRLFAEDVAAFRAKVRELSLELLPEEKPLAVREP